MSTTTTLSVPEPYVAPADRIVIERWSGERSLFAFTIVVSISIWLLLAVSVIGILYAAFLGMFFFFAHLLFVAHVRGNGVRIGPEQFPALDERIRGLAARMGLDPVPQAYLIQGGGVLNAFATRFLRTHMVILHTDLLDACGDDEAARDMIIGHELGHIHAGHLRLMWLILPGYLVPFLGSALSRAREYTCDRYGAASAGDPDGALRGLTILAAGPNYGRSVNRHAMVGQRAELDTGWMTLGEWFSSHPPLARRMLALDPGLGAGQRPRGTGPVRAALLVVAMTLPFVAGSVGLVVWAANQVAVEGEAAAVASDDADGYVAPSMETAQAMLEERVATVAAFLDAEDAAGRGIPATYEELRDRWEAGHPGQELPRDPYDGDVLGFNRTATGYILWSAGPDGSIYTHDDIVYRFEGGARP